MSFDFAQFPIIPSTQAGLIQSATVPLSSNDILNLHLTPVRVVPGKLGTIIFPLFSSVLFTPGNIAYTTALGTNGLFFTYETAAGNPGFRINLAGNTVKSTFVDPAEASFGWNVHFTTAVNTVAQSLPLASLNGKTLTVNCLAIDALSAGNGTAILSVLYAQIKI